MVFSEKSDISLVVTSCGRFELLSGTLESFDRFNTAAIRKVIITEDSGDEAVWNCVPGHWMEYTEVICNRPSLGQIPSIDLAYSKVETNWIFHCEDDWCFYRPGFIEDSLLHLETDPCALQVWLRSYAHDLAVNSPYVYLGSRRVVNGVASYLVESHKSDWQGFSFNPGLRRTADYHQCAPYAKFGGEKQLSLFFSKAQRYALILENDAVLHTGFGLHVITNDDTEKRRRRKRLEAIKITCALLVGLFLGALLW